MGVLSSIFDWIRGFVRKVFKKVRVLLKKYWWVVALVALVAFAPALTVWLAGIGAPGWLVTAFGAVSTFATPALLSVWTATAAVGLAAWGAFAGAGPLIQAATVLGAIALVDPDSAEDLITEAGETVGEVAALVATGVTTGVVSGVGSAVLGSSSMPVIFGVGLLALLIFTASGDGDEPENA